MKDGHLPKDVFYGELMLDSRPIGRPMLLNKDVCKRDLKSADIYPDSWEITTPDGLKRAEARREQHDRRE